MRDHSEGRETVFRRCFQVRLAGKRQRDRKSVELDMRETGRMRFNLVKLKEVCFFFSAISTSKLDSKKRKTPQRSQETRESDESNDESPVDASQLSSPGKQTFPAISYWVACQTNNGSAINALKIQRAVASFGLEYYSSRASRKRNCHDLNQLCQVLKDHKNLCLMQLVGGVIVPALPWVS